MILVKWTGKDRNGEVGEHEVWLHRMGQTIYKIKSGPQRGPSRIRTIVWMSYPTKDMELQYNNKKYGYELATTGKTFNKPAQSNNNAQQQIAKSDTQQQSANGDARFSSYGESLRSSAAYASDLDSFY